jgi:hypothetical protein
MRRRGDHGNRLSRADHLEIVRRVSEGRSALGADGAPPHPSDRAPEGAARGDTAGRRHPARLAAHAAPQLRHAPAPGGHRSAHDPGAARSSGCPHHDDLHAPRRAGRARRHQPARSWMSRDREAGSAPVTPGSSRTVPLVAHRYAAARGCRPEVLCDLRRDRDGYCAGRRPSSGEATAIRGTTPTAPQHASRPCLDPPRIFRD